MHRPWSADSTARGTSATSSPIRPGAAELLGFTASGLSGRGTGPLRLGTAAGRGAGRPTPCLSLIASRWSSRAVTKPGPCPGCWPPCPSGYQALVVDNGSDDGSASVAAEHGAQVVVEPTPGYGAAVQTGVETAGDSIVCVLDGDGSMDPGELPVLVALVRSGVELAVGRRRPAPGTRWPAHARAGNAVGGRPAAARNSVCRYTISGPCGPSVVRRYWIWESRTGGPATRSSSWSARPEPVYASQSVRSLTDPGRRVPPRCPARSEEAPSQPGTS